MAITVFWDEVELDIMRIEYEGEWSLADQESLSKRSAEMVGDEITRNDVIVHVHQHTHFPRYIAPKDLRHVLQGIPSNPGVRVFVGAPIIMQTVLDMFSGLIGGKMGVEITTAKTVEVARQIIREKRAQQKG